MTKEEFVNKIQLLYDKMDRNKTYGEGIWNRYTLQKWVYEWEYLTPATLEYIMKSANEIWRLVR